MTQTVLLDKKQFSRGSLTMAGTKHKRHSSIESEGLISSPVHVDSEDSSAPKRKCISLNQGGFEGFDVPIEVFTLSKLSSSERKTLEIKLRAQVNKIQALQRRLLSVNLKQHGKVQAPVKQIGKDRTSHLMLMKRCEGVLKSLMQHKIAQMLFNKPVDIVALNIPDYFDIIKNPMDLGTIKKRLNSSGYKSAWDFLADVRLTFTNATTYNPPSNSVHIMAITLSKYFEARWKPIEKKLLEEKEEERREAAEASRRSFPAPYPVPAPYVAPAAQSKKKRTPVVTESSPVVMERIKPKMTLEERQNLGDRLASVSAELPVYIIDYLRRCCANNNNNNGDINEEDEIEIDIDLLDDEMLFELQKLLDRFMTEKQEGTQDKNEMCDVEVLNVSGVSNSSMHPSKVDEPMEEDVDICGEDPPGTSFVPVVIEKEIKESKCSTSSSSSDSASSDSGSSSSSGSGSHGRAVDPSKISKDKARSELPVEQENSDVISSLERPISGLTVRDQDAQSKPGNSNPEGESERQASPDKLYRAALMRSRFADTIVKAREKLLTPDEKGDPEKLRREKEELERQQREEKARILAEAKAVEDARKRAEAEAEAEAKRKREIEREAAREAARQALLKMEKTVEINDTVMMQELEMLRSAPAENIVSSVDETSPDNTSPDGLPDFMRSGSGNPLEQLGLFMKVDDDEEDEDFDQPPETRLLNDTAEEGEID